ncbi:hypothetical protein AB0O91_29340 [Kitasatospora sp. NPDC089797]|uniref:hypothetical protein n=1 Tax=Kitasatospora sp. NPDC089797 TaxID=3155298 RepID=UPI00343C8DF6
MARSEPPVPDCAALLRQARRSAVHWEMRGLWLIDERLVLLPWFAGDGAWAGARSTTTRPR